MGARRHKPPQPSIQSPPAPPTDARLPAAAGVVRHAAVGGGAAAEALGLAPVVRKQEEAGFVASAEGNGRQVQAEQGGSTSLTRALPSPPHSLCTRPHCARARSPPDRHHQLLHAHLVDGGQQRLVPGQNGWAVERQPCCAYRMLQREGGGGHTAMHAGGRQPVRHQAHTPHVHLPPASLVHPEVGLGVAPLGLEHLSRCGSRGGWGRRVRRFQQAGVRAWTEAWGRCKRAAGRQGHACTHDMSGTASPPSLNDVPPNSTSQTTPSSAPRCRTPRPRAPPARSRPGRPGAPGPSPRCGPGGVGGRGDNGAEVDGRVGGVVGWGGSGCWRRQGRGKSEGHPAPCRRTR